MTCTVAAGSYSSAAQPGIQILEFDEKNGHITPLSRTAGVENPSFLAWDTPRRRLFAVSEKGQDGEVVAFRYHPGDGTLSEVHRQKTRGSDPCYVNVDATGRWLLGVNYTSGSIYVFPIGDDGSPGEMSEFIQLSGKGVRGDRQEGPHPHTIVNIPGTDLWIVADLGTDRLLVYRLTRQGKLDLQHTTTTQAGAGPRHIAFHPRLPVVYVLQELAATVAVFAYEKNGIVTRLQEDQRAIPAGFSGPNLSADIHVETEGKFLYASNRGHDSLAVFAIQADGKLTFLAHCPTGKAPRNFVMIPQSRALLVANQESDDIRVMEYGEDGIPRPTGTRYAMPRPVCLLLSGE